MTLRSTTRSFRDVMVSDVTPIIVGGVYRVVRERGSGVEIGDICVLVEDDNTSTPLLYSGKWSRSHWVSIDKLEFLGVIEG